MWSPWQTARNRTTQWDYQKLCVCRFLKGQLYSVPSNPLSVLRWKKYTRINYFIKLRKFSMGPETFETISETSSDSIKQQLHRGASQSTCWDAELSNCHKLNLKLVKNHHQKKNQQTFTHDRSAPQQLSTPNFLPTRKEKNVSKSTLCCLPLLICRSLRNSLEWVSSSSFISLLNPKTKNSRSHYSTELTFGLSWEPRLLLSKWNNSNSPKASYENEVCVLISSRLLAPKPFVSLKLNLMPTPPKLLQLPAYSYSSQEK